MEIKILIIFPYMVFLLTFSKTLRLKRVRKLFTYLLLFSTSKYYRPSKYQNLILTAIIIRKNASKSLPRRQGVNSWHSCVAIKISPRFNEGFNPGYNFMVISYIKYVICVLNRLFQSVIELLFQDGWPLTAEISNRS